MRFEDLTNTRKIRHGEMARTATQAIALLRRRIVASTADDYGAITVWNDRNGRYRCEAHRWMKTVDSQVFSSLADVRKWWAKWVKKIAGTP